jgi:hypothetical protein
MHQVLPPLRSSRQVAHEKLGRSSTKGPKTLGTHDGKVNETEAAKDGSEVGQVILHLRTDLADD